MMMNEYRILLGHRLKQLRRNRGENQAQFAKGCGLGLKTYQNYERGEREPTAGIIAKICRYTGSSSDWIILGQESKVPSLEMIRDHLDLLIKSKNA